MSIICHTISIADTEHLKYDLAMYMYMPCTIHHRLSHLILIIIVLKWLLLICIL